MTDNQTANAGRGRDIYWIGGSKGGVGKSMQTIGLLDYLMTKKDYPSAEKYLQAACDNATSAPDRLMAFSAWK